MRAIAVVAVLALAACTNGPDAAVALRAGETAVATGGCVDETMQFTTRAWEPVLQRCAGCHVADGPAAATRLVLTPGDDAANERSFRAIASVNVAGEPLVVLKPTGRHPAGHGGGQLFARGSSEEASLTALVDWVRGSVADCAAAPMSGCEDEPGPRVVRRLTHLEYRNTVQDLVGVDAAEAAGFAPDTVVDGFANAASALKVSALLADQYREAAEAIATRAVETRLGAIAPCGAAADASCVARFIHDIGQRAFRRPLTTEEQGAYGALFATASAGASFAEGVRWTLAALLASPHFLYRTELGVRRADGRFDLTPWELASELSYLFLQSMPDEGLFAAASSGELARPEVLRAHIERLSADARATRTMARFFEQWLLLDRLPNVPRDATTYPDLTPAIREAMRGEIVRFVSNLVTRNGSLGDALQADGTFLTDALADYYGVPRGTAEADAEGFRKVPLSGTPYGGLLTLGGLLTTHALPNGSSPIHRGKLVRERLLCQPIAPPPTGVAAAPPPIDPSLTTRERYAEHAQKVECASCHRLMDPIGFAFEHFDGAGRWRARDGAHDIDDTGNIEGSLATNGSFSGPNGLAGKLAASAEVEACFAKAWTTWALGGGPAGRLGCALQSQTGAGSGVSTLRETLTTLAHFRTRTGSPGEQDVPGGGLSFPPVDGETTTTPPAPTGDVTFTVTDQSRWESGSCHEAFVTNGSASARQWTVSRPLEGTMTDVWNARASTAEGVVTFEGVEWNATLQPGGTAPFGYCVRF